MVGRSRLAVDRRTMAVNRRPGPPARIYVVGMIAERQHNESALEFKSASRNGQRVGAGFAGLALLGVFVVVAFGALLLVGHIAQVPNAYDSGREYGSAPDTWTGTFQGAAVSIGVVYAVTLLFTGVVALLRFAATGRRLSRRGWIVLPSALTALFTGLMVAVLFAGSGSAQPFTNCDEFQFDRAAFTSANRSQWQLQSRGLDDCHVIDKLDRAQIVAMLGKPKEDDYFALRYHGGQLVIEFKEEDVEGRPVSVWAW